MNARAESTVTRHLPSLLFPLAEVRMLNRMFNRMFNPTHHVLLSVSALLLGVACTDPPAANEGEGEEGEGEEGEGEGDVGEGEGEGEGGEGEGDVGEGEGEGDPNALSTGPVCTQNGWCFEAPVPGGGPVLAVAAASADTAFASTPAVFFHRTSASLAHVQHPGGTIGPSSMWAANDHDAWAIVAGALHHFNGLAWLPDPAVVGLDTVSGVDEHDVWAVGGLGTVAHFDGVAWQSFAAHLENLVLVDVYATGTRSAVAAAVDITSGFGAVIKLALVENNDGVLVLNATDLNLPASDFLSNASVFGAGDEVWFAQPGHLWRQSAGAWTEVVSDNFTVGQDIWGSGVDDVFFTAGNALLHWDGGALTTLAIPNASNVLAISGVVSGASDTLWLADNNGALHRKSDAGTRSDNLPLVATDFFSVQSAGSDTVALSRAGELAIRNADGTWSLAESPTTSPLVGLGETSDGVVLFAQGGSFLRNNGDWDLILGGAGLTEACVDDAGTSYAIGAKRAGRLVDGEWDVVDLSIRSNLAGLRCASGTAFARSTSGSSTAGVYEFHDGAFRLRNLASLFTFENRVAFASSADEAWAYGDSFDVFTELTERHLMHLADGVWREVDFPGFTVASIDGSAADDVLFVGESGSAARYDGSSLVDISAVGAPDFIAGFAKGGGAYRAVSNRGAIWDFANGQWSETEPASIDNTFGDPLVDVAFFGDEIFATTRFQAMHFSAGVWTELSDRLVDVEASPAGGVFAVTDFGDDLLHFEGGAFVAAATMPTFARGLFMPRFGSGVYTFDDGEVLRRSGSTFTSEGTGASAFFTRSFFYGADDAHLTLAGTDRAGSDSALILEKSGNTWTEATEFSIPIATAALASGTVFVGADLSVARERNGVTTELIAGIGGFSQPGIAAVIFDVDDIWAISAGSLIHFDGAAWSSAEPVGVTVSSLARGDGDTLFAGAGPGSLLRFTP